LKMFYETDSYGFDLGSGYFCGKGGQKPGDPTRIRHDLFDMDLNHVVKAY
uniref:Phosphoesterase n=1 Tax=Anisakis simplex TaxID=6269 RepID=A0A0M3JEP9_ANISI